MRHAGRGAIGPPLQRDVGYAHARHAHSAHMRLLSHFSFLARVIHPTPSLLTLTLASRACGAGDPAPVDVDDETDPSGVVFPSLIGDEAPAPMAGGDPAAAGVRPSDFTPAEVG